MTFPAKESTAPLGLAMDSKAQQGKEMDPTSDFSLLISTLAHEPQSSPLCTNFHRLSDFNLDDQRGSELQFNKHPIYGEATLCQALGTQR